MGQRHLELDLRQLLRRLANLVQERQPAWVGVDLVEQVIRHDLAEAAVAVLDRLVEPPERLVGLAAAGRCQLLAEGATISSYVID